MKPIILAILVMLIPSCSTIPFVASYTGAVAGHKVIVGVSGKDGVAVAVEQK